MKLTEQQKEIIRRFFVGKPVFRAYVFGSYARGDARENSDVDLLIEWDYSQPLGWGYARTWRELNVLLNKHVDFVSAKWVDPSIESTINREKELVYER